MKILQTQVLRGPNYWSVSCSKLVVVLLDLVILDDYPSAMLAGFIDDLFVVLPSLKERVGDLEYRGFVVEQGLSSSVMVHLLKDVALELQTLAGMPVDFGSVCETASPGTYHVTVEYQHEAAGRYAVRAALRLCQSVIERGDYPKAELRTDLGDLQGLRADAAQGASTEALIQEAENRGIPWTHLEKCDLFQLGYGKSQKRMKAALTSHSNVLGVELACDKEQTKKILESMGAPVPLGKVIYAFQELEDAVHDLGGYPIVIKPLDGNQGRGITVDIRSWRQADIAYDRAKEISDGVIVERFYQGRDHRILVINHRVVAVAERVPAHVVGNGLDSISTLVHRENQDVRRGKGHDTALTQIKLDSVADELLRHQGFSLDTVLKAGQICYLRANANLSTGGVAIDRTEEIHPDTVWLAERASRIIDLDIVGIDVLTTDITQPLKAVEGVIVEVNAAPGLRMHMAPSEGIPRNVAAPILDMLFPAEAPTRIPIVAVAESGADGAMPLIAHLLSQGYDTVGYAAGEGAYIDGHLLKQGNFSNARGAELILQDPTVDIAVLATSPDSILRSGLAFQHCDVGVLFQAAADPAGTRCAFDYKTKALSVIAQAVHGDGYALLNADDEKVAAMASQVQGKVAYFSTDPDNSLLQAHVQAGGIAVGYDQGYVVIFQQGTAEQVESLDQLPSTVRGCEPAAMAHVLAAVLIAYLQGVSLEQIRMALQTYRLSEQTPVAPGDSPKPDSNLPGSPGPQINFKDFAIAPQAKPPQVEVAIPQFSQACDLSMAVGVGSLEPDTQQAQEAVGDLAAASHTVASAVSLDEAIPAPSNFQAEQSQQGVDGRGSQLELFQSSIATAEQMLERVQMEFAAFSQALDQQEMKAWGIERGGVFVGWIKAQGPVLGTMAQKVLVAVTMVGAIAFVVGRAVVVAMWAILQEVAVWGWTKLEMAIQPMNADSSAIDPTLKDVMTLFGKEGQGS